MSNQNPSWVGRIQQGDFTGAESDLANIAARQVREQQAANEIQRLGEQSAYGKYTAVPAAIAVAELYKQGKIQNEAQAVQAYADCLERENMEFRAKMRPGYLRTSTEPYLPADQECRDYVAVSIRPLNLNRV